MPDSQQPSVEETVDATQYTFADQAAPIEIEDLLAGVDQGRLLHYVILNRIGRGGMGVVFAAYDEKLDRKVALKILRRQVGEEGRRRLVREAQALARVSHPNVVQIHEIGEHRGLTFIVMEFVDGDTLRAWLRREPRPTLATIVETFIRAGRGLAAAHARAVVHRDFKPDNVMVGREGRVWVLDFGLAREHASAAPEPVEYGSAGSELSSELTRAGSLLGTPVYMAPEQFAGADVDARSDQFSFCVALWEAVYGERPFAGEGVNAIAHAITSGAIREPQRKDVPGRLRAILERGLSRDPGQRWPSMDALLAALEQQPRRRLAPLFAGAAALVIAGSLGLSWWRGESERRAAAAIEAECAASGAEIEASWSEATRARLRAGFEATTLGMASSAWSHSATTIDAHVAAWSALRTEVCRDTRLQQRRTPAEHARVVACLDEGRAALAALLDAWSDPDEAVVIAAPYAASRLRPPAACVDPKWLGQRLQPPPGLEVQVQELRSRLEAVLILDQSGRLEAASRAADTALGEAETLGWLPLVAEARLYLAQVREHGGNTDAARQSFERSSLEALGSGNDAIALDAATGLVNLIGSELNDPAGARYWAELAARYVDRLGLAGSLREATLLNNRGTTQAAAGDYAEALALHRAALAIRERELGPEHPSTASSLVNIGGALAALGQHEAALAAYERSLAITRATLGPEHVHVSYALNSVANIVRDQGRYDESLTLLRESLRIREAALGSQHPRLIPALNSIGNVLMEIGEYEEAIASYQRGIAILEATRGPEDPQVGMLLVGVGRAHLVQGQAEQALAAYRRALEILGPALGPEHVHVATLHHNIGDALLSLGRQDQALEALRTALPISEAKLGPEHEEVGQIHVTLGRTYESLGELDLALAEFERALGIFTAGKMPKPEAGARFAVGRVRDAKGEREAGRALVEAAADSFRALDEGGAAELAEVEAWLAARSP